MYFHKRALPLLLACTASSTRAFISSRSGRTNTFNSVLLNNCKNVKVSYSRNRRSQMNLFQSIFGSVEQPRIAYENLDHPGPELAAIAKDGKVVVNSERDSNLEAATFAGGCFWGLELAYQRVPGVVYTAVGYTQGPELEPTYNEVCSGGTGHTEAVIVYYDPKECTYENLLDTFFDRVNPTTVNGQGNDFGTQYRTGVYFHTTEQEELGKARFAEVQKQYKKPIASELKSATPFWPAEKYHQQYLEKGGRMGMPQDASKGATDTIRCYG